MHTDDRGFVTGIYGRADYRRGEGPELRHRPLSQSLAKYVLDGCAEDAWRISCGERERHSDQQSTAMRGGSLLDALATADQPYSPAPMREWTAIGKTGKELAAVQYEDWSTLRIMREGSASSLSWREATSLARDRGLTVVTGREFDDAREEAELLAIRAELAGCDLSRYQRQVAVYWVANATDGTPVQCRGMWDLYDPAAGEIADLKRVGTLSPRYLDRAVIDYGWALQAAAYLQSAEACGIELPTWRWLFARTNPVLACQYRPISAALLEVGTVLWQRAVDAWARGITSGVWDSIESDSSPLEAADWHVRLIEGGS